MRQIVEAAINQRQVPLQVQNAGVALNLTDDFRNALINAPFLSSK
jgi:hypothetical protein